MIPAHHHQRFAAHAVLLAGLLLTPLPPAALAETPPQPSPPARFAPPRDASIPDNAAGRQILLGRRLVTDTKHLLPDHAGDVLNCTNCHLGAGKVKLASPFVGVAANYPRSNPRAEGVMTLEERINGCFQRSMNGKPLATDSPQRKALVAYFDWLSTGLERNASVEGRGIGRVDTSLVPDPDRGKRIYASACAECHGGNGEGSRDGGGNVVFPPLWGEQSFDIGAGIARTYTAAAFIKQNMPTGYGLNPPIGQDGALSDQDAVRWPSIFPISSGRTSRRN